MLVPAFASTSGCYRPTYRSNPPVQATAAPTQSVGTAHRRSLDEIFGASNQVVPATGDQVVPEGVAGDAPGRWAIVNGGPVGRNTFLIDTISGGTWLLVVGDDGALQWRPMGRTR